MNGHDRSRAVFVDKDGTLITNVPYNVDPRRIRLMPGTLKGLRTLSRAGFKIVIVTNQSGIALGRFDESQLENVKLHLEAILAAAEVVLSGFYFCPHHPDGTITRFSKDCDCRKPSPGLLLQASDQLNIDISQSWMIGDILDDVEAGNRSGCRTILFDHGSETEWKRAPYRQPDFVVDSFESVASIILSQAEERETRQGKSYESHVGRNR